MSGKHKFASPNANKVKEKKKQWETISTEEWNTVLQNECDLPYITAIWKNNSARSQTIDAAKLWKTKQVLIKWVF